MRHRIVGSYYRPESADNWLIELYDLHVLLITVGSGRQADKGVVSGPTDVEGIDDMFEQCLYEFARAAHDAVARACYEEIANACDPHLISPSRLRSWLANEASELIRRGFSVNQNGVPVGGSTGDLFVFPPFKGEGASFMSKVGGWPSVIRIFKARFWREAKLYGGEKWAAIATETMNLLGEIKRGKPTSVMCAVHGLVGLRHNTGHLFAKASMGRMAISQRPLDQITNCPLTGALYNCSADVLPVNPNCSVLPRGIVITQKMTPNAKKVIDPGKISGSSDKDRQPTVADPFFRGDFIQTFRPLPLVHSPPFKHGKQFADLPLKTSPLSPQ
jgi:hypothetical protein